MPRKCLFLTVAFFTVLLSASTLRAELLVHEGFELADGPLAGAGSGSGWADGSTWEETTFGAIYESKSPGLTFPGLAVSGGFAERAAVQSRGAIGRLVSPGALAPLTAAESEFWFSVLVRNQDEDNTAETILFLLSSIRLEDDGGGPGPDHLNTFDLGPDVGVGFTYDVNGRLGGGGIRGVAFDGDGDLFGGPLTMVESLPIGTQSETHLVVGHVQWGADGFGHQLTLYALPASGNVPGTTPVPLPPPIDSLNFDLDPPLLRYVTLGGRRWAAVDEIRLGTTPADVGVQEFTCPAAGDTRCTGLTFTGPQLAGGINGPGLYTFTATGTDQSGDPVVYTFTFVRTDDPLLPEVVVGPQIAGTVDMPLDLGEWRVTVEVDDVLVCDDRLPDAICEVDIRVQLVEPPTEPPAVVYEGFDIPGIDVAPVFLSTEGSGFGWAPDAFWEETTGGSLYSAELPGMEFPGLAVSGGQARRPDSAGRGALGRRVGPAERARLTEKELWFSVLVNNDGGGTEALIFLFSSIRLEDNGLDLLHLANLPDTGFDLGDATGVGFVFNPGNTLGQFVETGPVGIRGAVYNGNADGTGVPTLTGGSFQIDDAADTHLVVGRAIWGEGGTGHQFSVFAMTPSGNVTHASPIPLEAPIGALQFDFDPATLEHVTFGGRQTAAIDEIRLGTTPEEVGVTAPLCPPLGDTHCTGVTSEGPGLPGLYTVTATATDDSLDDPIIFTFVISKAGEPNIVIGPTEVAVVGGQAERSIELDLTPGTYTVTVTADDDVGCDDIADNATCQHEIVVMSPPEPVDPPALVYEGFEIPGLENSPQLWVADDFNPDGGTGVGSGFGWETDSVWRETAFNRFYRAKPGGLFFPGLLSKGGFAERDAFQGRGAAGRPVGEAQLAELTDLGGEFWFSVLVRNQDEQSVFETLLFLLASVRLEDDNALVRNMVQFDLGEATAVGFTFDLNNTLDDDTEPNIRAVVFDGDPDMDGVGMPIVSDSGYVIVDRPAVHLVAGRVRWGNDIFGHNLTVWVATGPENTLHLSPVPMSTTAATLDFDMDPTDLRFITFGGRRWAGVDEIRLGKSAADVGVSLIDCPPGGDTRCTELVVEGPGNNAPGTYTATATAVDEAGDPITYVFTLENLTSGATTVLDPQPENTASFELTAGSWRISVEVDDACPGVAPENRCSRDVTVGGGGMRFIRGNVDAEGTINISDPIFLLSWLFQGGAEPPCLESGNVDGQGTINISDPIFLLSWLFQGGPPPPAPFPDCGRPDPDPGPGAVDCASFAPCP